MTPKEKAKDLLDKFFQYIPAQEELEYEYAYAKQCTLIAVNEIINSNPHSNPLNTEVYSTMKYWQEVKQEIEKL